MYQKNHLDKRRKFSHPMTVSKVYNYIYLWVLTKTRNKQKQWVLTKTRNKQKQPETRNYPQFRNWGNLQFSTNFFVFQTLSPNAPKGILDQET